MQYFFIRYKAKRHPYMTDVMTGGEMQGVVNSAASGLTGAAAGAIPDYANAPNPFNTGGRNEAGGQHGIESEYKAVSAPGPIWSPRSGGGPRATAAVGVSGPGVYFLETGGIYTQATHALKKGVGG